MQDSNMRTVAVRFSGAEHRLLRRFASAQGVSVETLVREALALAPFGAREARAGRLHVVEGDTRRAGRGARDHALPLG
jgi:hypothetical protein